VRGAGEQSGHPTVGTMAAAAEASGGGCGDPGAAARRRWDLPCEAAGNTYSCSCEMVVQWACFDCDRVIFEMFLVVLLNSAVLSFVFGMSHPADSSKLFVVYYVAEALQFCFVCMN
jgi:hypothetical protein